MFAGSGRSATSPSLDPKGPAVIDLREPRADASSTGGDVATELRQHRRIRLAGLVALVVLNALDVLTTYRALEAGATEANPVGAFFIDTGLLPWAKLAVLVFLGVKTLRAEPKLATTSALWFVVGVYAMAIVSNTLSLRHLGVL